MTPTVLVLAGRDPTSGAGLDADREAVERLGVSFRGVATCDTDQDGVRVRAVRPRLPGEWRSEALAHVLRYAPRVLKTGLLPGAAHVWSAVEVVDALLRRDETQVVVDPVLAASGGEPFLDDDGIEVLREELLPRGVVVTPNVPEAARLAHVPADELAVDPARRAEAAYALIELGVEAVLLKGGHGSEEPVLDLVLQRGRAPIWHERPRVPGGALHGSGCRYASTVAAGLALGRSLVEASREAGRWVGELLES